MWKKTSSSRLLTRVLPALLAAVVLAGCTSGQSLKGNKEEGLKLARLLRDQGRLEAAAEVYARLDLRQKLNGNEMLEYATVAAPVRKPAEALTLYARARDALGGNIDTLTSQEALALCLGMGRAQLALGRSVQAQSAFECALKRDANNAAALNGIGVLLDAQGRHDDARRRFELALNSEPGNPAVMNNLALSWLASGNADRAISQLKSADLSNPNVRLNLALAWLVKGDEQSAREVLAQLASPARIDGLMASLEQRAEALKNSASGSTTLLMASTQPLALGDEAQ